ncbi:hypothetical protein ACERCG_11000 [Mannheimia sp. E30BD]|uniref:hypothetical protein n=1 Tax=Mannheimia sp. E30BD TaxID=3278708 RepID=UPI00359EB254
MNINTYGNNLRIEPIRVGSPITRFVEPSLVPVGIGNIFDGSTSKSLEMYWNNTKLLSGEKMRTLPSKKIKVLLFCYLYFATGLFIVLIGGKYLIRIFYGIYHL